MFPIGGDPYYIKWSCVRTTNDWDYAVRRTSTPPARKTITYDVVAPFKGCNGSPIGLDAYEFVTTPVHLAIIAMYQDGITIRKKTFEELERLYPDAYITEDSDNKIPYELTQLKSINGIDILNRTINTLKRKYPTDSYSVDSNGKIYKEAPPLLPITSKQAQTEHQGTKSTNLDADSRVLTTPLTTGQTTPLTTGQTPLTTGQTTPLTTGQTTPLTTGQTTPLTILSTPLTTGLTTLLTKQSTTSSAHTTPNTTFDFSAMASTDFEVQFDETARHRNQIVLEMRNTNVTGNSIIVPIGIKYNNVIYARQEKTILREGCIFLTYGDALQSFMLKTSDGQEINNKKFLGECNLLVNTTNKQKNTSVCVIKYFDREVPYIISKI